MQIRWASDEETGVAGASFALLFSLAALCLYEDTPIYPPTTWLQETQR